MSKNLKLSRNKLNSFLTGNKDVDRKILSELSDRELLIVCQSNKYSQEKVCDETFFRNLVYNRYSETIKYKEYVKIRNWKNFYLSIIYYLDKLKREYDFDYNVEKKKEKDISPELEYLIRKLIPEHYRCSKDAALLSSIGKGHLAVVKYLIEQGADIHFLNNYALILASKYGHLPIVKYLVDQGFNIHSQSIFGDTALETARKNRHSEVIEYLQSLM